MSASLLCFLPHSTLLSQTSALPFRSQKQMYLLGFFLNMDTLLSVFVSPRKGGLKRCWGSIPAPPLMVWAAEVTLCLGASVLSSAKWGESGSDLLGFCEAG